MPRSGAASPKQPKVGWASYPYTGRSGYECMPTIYSDAKGPFAIFNCYDDNAMGAIAALRQNGRSDVKGYSFNATAPAVQAVKDGTMTATLGVDLTSAGKMLVDQIPDILSAGDQWKPKSFVPGYTLVTKDNVDQFMKDNPQ